MGPLKRKTTHSAARAGAKQEQLEPKLHQEEHTHNDAEFELRTLREHDAHRHAPLQKAFKWDYTWTAA